MGEKLQILQRKSEFTTTAKLFTLLFYRKHLCVILSTMNRILLIIIIVLVVVVVLLLIDSFN